MFSLQNSEIVLKPLEHSPVGEHMPGVLITKSRERHENEELNSQDGGIEREFERGFLHRS